MYVLEYYKRPSFVVATTGTGLTAPRRGISCCCSAQSGPARPSQQLEGTQACDWFLYVCGLACVQLCSVNRQPQLCAVCLCLLLQTHVSVTRSTHVGSRLYGFYSTAAVCVVCLCVVATAWLIRASCTPRAGSPAMLLLLRWAPSYPSSATLPSQPRPQRSRHRQPACVDLCP
jgi:hypothetical protein